MSKSEVALNESLGAQPSVARTEPRSFHWTFGLTAGLVLAAVVIATAIVAPFVLSAPADKLSADTQLGPSLGHPFGTDSFGRDMFSRSLVATRLTVLMATAATTIAVVTGVLVGTGIWLAPRRIREGGLRALEVAVSYPGLLVALIITSILGAGALAVVVGIGIANIAAFGRLTANLAANISQRDFVTTARLSGVPRHKIILRHMLPNMAEPMLILVATGFSVAIIEISGLSFVGLGVQSPDYDWGKLLIDALPAIYTQPSQVFGPAVMIIVTILAAMLIGDGLAASADPRTAVRRRSRKELATVGAPVAPAEDGNLVHVRDLRVLTESGSELLHGVSFVVHAGEILGVVGESGSGKSLTAMALARLLPDGLTARASEVRVGNLDMLRKAPNGALASAIALVYQDPGSTFNPALRMGTQLTDVLRGHNGLSRADAKQRILRVLQTVHMSDPELRLRQHPHELSGGMRQRAMIAAALATGPQLIIADEPTTALDVTVQAEILREFRRINRELSVAMLFISHDIGVVVALCNRVLVMQNGQIVEEVTSRQLAEEDVSHPYTKRLLAATPRLTDPRPVRK